MEWTLMHSRFSTERRAGGAPARGADAARFRPEQTFTEEVDNVCRWPLATRAQHFQVEKGDETARSLLPCKASDNNPTENIL